MIDWLVGWLVGWLEPVPCTFMSANRRNNETRAHIGWTHWAQRSVTSTGELYLYLYHSNGWWLLQLQCKNGRAARATMWWQAQTFGGYSESSNLTRYSGATQLRWGENVCYIHIEFSFKSDIDRTLEISLYSPKLWAIVDSLVFTAQRYASAVYAVVVCLSACLSVSVTHGVVSKRLNLLSCNQCHMIAQGRYTIDALFLLKLNRKSCVLCEIALYWMVMLAMTLGDPNPKTTPISTLFLRFSIFL